MDTASKITQADQNALKARNIPAFKHDTLSEYYTYTDIASANLDPVNYTNVTVDTALNSVVTGTSLIVKGQRMFPR